MSTEDSWSERLSGEEEDAGNDSWAEKFSDVQSEVHHKEDPVTRPSEQEILSEKLGEIDLTPSAQGASLSSLCAAEILVYLSAGWL